jgi:hypothetical protein
VYPAGFDKKFRSRQRRTTSFFKGKKSKRSHKTVDIKAFLTIFA